MREVAAIVALALTASGCSSIVTEGSADIAGITGATVASAVTTNPAAAAAAGLSAQAGARAGVHYAQRQVHRAAQDRIAQAAGELKVGQVAPWNSEDKTLERAQRGRVTVSRIISASGGLNCKEIVFSVDSGIERAPQSAFYITAICRDSARWKWASAEPATERWGALQ